MEDGGGARFYAAGDRLPVGVEAFPGGVGNDDLVLWVESRGAVVAGDSLIDRGNGLEIPEDWLDQGHVRELFAHAGVEFEFSSARSPEAASRARDDAPYTHAPCERTARSSS